ncbi:MAG: hypothetical protein IKZ14_03860 [Muribaculaceae bacterium]|nr:hypothetical protein [Muribaculaceae bacterium]
MFNRKKPSFFTKNFVMGVLCIVFCAIAFPFNIFSASQATTNELPKPRFHSQSSVPTDSFAPLPNQNASMLLRQPGFIPEGIVLTKDSIDTATEKMLDSIMADTTSVLNITTLPDSLATREQVKLFTPDPTRAVWLSALCPGLGQIYNRRYWKLPIVVGAYMGLGYATSWNSRMLTDYTVAYRDIMDTDPTTDSYMDFFPSTTKEEDLDKEWLKNILKRRKDYFRQNRDLCIICMVGVYLVAMVDAYVDASLAQFDISPDLSMKVTPAVIPANTSRLPSVGVQWALTF